MQPDHAARHDAPRPPRLSVVERTAPPAPEPSQELSDRRYLAAVAGVIALGFIVRLSYTLRSDFPLNDGALFYQMIRDIQANGYRLPAFTSFNSEGIPLAYPPLPFYVTGFVVDATPMGLLGALRWLPLIASTLAIPAFFLLARAELRSRTNALVATFLFSMLGPAFTWMLMGGGITRSFGYVFAILTMWQAREMYVRKSYRRAAIVGALAALTLASHLEMGWWTAFSCGLLFLAYGRHRAGVVSSVAVGVLGVVLCAPWWATVLAQHGPAPLIAAFHSGTKPLAGPIILIQYDVAVEPLFAIIGGLGLVGVVASLARRQYLLPGWLVSVALLDTRAFPTSSTVPLAMLAALGAAEILRIASQPAPDGAASRVVVPPRWLAGGALTAIACYAMLSAIIASPKLLTGLTPDERGAMAWAGSNTPSGSAFAVITQDGWAVDRTSEWFPVLSGRTSVATVQGSEWVAGDYRQRSVDYSALQDCAEEDGNCLLAWMSETGRTFKYVYITKIPPRVPSYSTEACCRSLQTALAHDSRFTRVYDGAGASIYEITGS